MTLVVLVSCEETPGEGFVSFSLMEGNISEVTKGSVSDYVPLPPSNSFHLTVTDKTSGATVYEGTLGNWNAETGLPSGNYSVTASYGDLREEGSAQPYFCGTEEFTIVGGQTKDVRITVSLGNSIVRILCTESFRNYYPIQDFVITTPNHSSGFHYDGSAVFVEYRFTVSGTLTGQDGKTVTLPEKTWNTEEATCYTVKYDVTNVGGLTVTISFNDTVETVELGDIDLNS